MGTSKLQFIPQYTYEDYAQWEGKWELIRGVPIAMSPQPAMKHQRINSRIARLLEDGLERCNQCEAFIPIDWKIDEDTVVQPDNLVVCHPFVYANFLTKTPVLIFEILSPSTALKDRTIKYEIYETQGVKYYVIVDFVREKAEVFELINGYYERMADISHEKFTFAIEDCSLFFDFHKIWI